MRRGRLVAALREVARQRGVNVVAGKRLAAINDGRQLVFADGTVAPGGLSWSERMEFHSRVRRLIAPAAPEPVYTDWCICGARRRGRLSTLAPARFTLSRPAGVLGAVREPGGAVCVAGSGADAPRAGPGFAGASHPGQGC